MGNNLRRSDVSVDKRKKKLFGDPLMYVNTPAFIYSAMFSWVAVD